MPVLRPHLFFYLYYLDPNVCERREYKVNDLLSSEENLISISLNFKKLLLRERCSEYLVRYGQDHRVKETMRRELEEIIKNNQRNVNKLKKLKEKKLLEYGINPKVLEDKEKILKDAQALMKSIWSDPHYRFNAIERYAIIQELKEIDKPSLNIEDYIRNWNLDKSYSKNFHELEELLKRAYSGKLLKIMIKVERCIIGLGNKGPFEVGMTLHPIFGLPYIPGSAVKGLFKRAFELWCLGGSGQRNIGYNTFKEIFVPILENEEEKEKKEDGIVFTDALLAVENGRVSGEICLDVMCPHIKPDETPLTEFKSPIPVQFWILRNAKMAFYAFPSTRAFNEGKAEEWIDTMEKFFKDLKDQPEEHPFTVISTQDGLDWILAFGAKTSSGYGTFKILEVNKLW